MARSKSQRVANTVKGGMSFPSFGKKTNPDEDAGKLAAEQLKEVLEKAKEQGKHTKEEIKQFLEDNKDKPEMAYNALREKIDEIPFQDIKEQVTDAAKNATKTAKSTASSFYNMGTNFMNKAADVAKAANEERIRRGLTGDNLQEGIKEGANKAAATAEAAAEAAAKEAEKTGINKENAMAFASEQATKGMNYAKKQNKQIKLKIMQKEL